MKTKEFLQEGPIDFVKKVGAGLAHGKAGWQSQDAANKQQQLIKNVTGKALQNWAGLSQSLTTAGRPITGKDAEGWFQKFSGAEPSSPAPVNMNPTQMNAWIQKEVANYIANKMQTGQAQGGQTPPGGPEAPTPPGGEEPQPQPQPGGEEPAPDEEEPQPQPGGEEPAPGEQQPEDGSIKLPVPLEQLTKEERAELRRQIQASMKV